MKAAWGIVTKLRFCWTASHHVVLHLKFPAYFGFLSSFYFHVLLHWA
jgi:hypothetical protein